MAVHVEVKDAMDLPEDVRLALQKLTGAVMERNNANGGRDPNSKAEALMQRMVAIEGVAETYARVRKEGCPFKVGDWIHPTKTSLYSGRGLPHKVIEVRSEPIHVYNNPSSNPDFGQYLDIRVLSGAQGRPNILPYWCESWQFEVWDPEVAIRGFEEEYERRNSNSTDA